MVKESCNAYFYLCYNYERAADRIGCSPYTIRRWETWIVPYRMCGGRQKYQVTGADQLSLSICLFIYPDTSSDNICTFIIANGGDIYSQQCVSRRCTYIGLTRNRSSKKNYEIFSPSSLKNCYGSILNRRILVLEGF